MMITKILDMSRDYAEFSNEYDRMTDHMKYNLQINVEATRETPNKSAQAV